MPDGVEVHVYGVEELARGTRELSTYVERRASEDLHRFAQTRADTAAGRIPRVTGHMADSVNVTNDGKGRWLVTMGGTRAPYAGWVEFGGTRGRPYVPAGRYFMPVVIDETGIEGAANLGAKQEIRGYRWPTVTAR